MPFELDTRTNVLHKVEELYEEDKEPAKLCLLAVAGIGAVAAAGLGIRALLQETPEVFAAVGSPEFDALQDSVRLTADTPLRPIATCDALGDKHFLAAPSISRGASTWRVNLPDELYSTQAMPHGPGEILQFEDLTVTHTPVEVRLERPTWGTVSLRKPSSTGRIYDPEGTLRMALNPAGDELRYDTEGKLTGIARNAHRRIDLYTKSLDIGPKPTKT
ncbi:MAG TPA: hypothetical protein V6C81_29785 [Planktothrix sp.]|jgi:hypothetical protein